MGIAYERRPWLDVDDERAICGYDAIVREIDSGICDGPFVLAVETYPGVKDGVDSEGMLGALKEAQQIGAFEPYEVHHAETFIIPPPRARCASSPWRGTSWFCAHTCAGA